MDRDGEGRVSEHTPTPWTAWNHSSRNGRGLSFYVGIEGRLPVALVYDQNGAEANATFIVEAVNSHETLVSALAKIWALATPDADANTIAEIGSLANEALRGAFGDAGRTALTAGEGTKR